MFIATMDSESKQWMALGETEREAKEAISDKWNQVQRLLVEAGWKNKPELMSAKKLDEYYGITAYELNPGECLTSEEV